jgi:hypothetical protein
MAKKFYQCTCFERCKGGREVSRSTYHRHGRIREQEQLNSQLAASHTGSHGSVVGDGTIVGGNDDSTSDSEEEEGEEGDSNSMEIDSEVVGRGSMGLESDPGNMPYEV